MQLAVYIEVEAYRLADDDKGTATGAVRPIAAARSPSTDDGLSGLARQLVPQIYIERLPHHGAHAPSTTLHLFLEREPLQRLHLVFVHIKGVPGFDLCASLASSWAHSAEPSGVRPGAQLRAELSALQASPVAVRSSAAYPAAT